MQNPKILSIDYDFFQDATATEQVMLYPDGHDFTKAEMRNFIWGRHYSNPDELMKIQINKKLIAEMLLILSKQNKDIPVIIRNSHVFAYQTAMFLHEATQIKPDVYNIDMHHDMFNEGGMKGKVDCGNWLLTAKTEGYVNNITWIGRTASKELCPVNALSVKPDMIIYDDLNLIKDMKFDAIFMCRSDMWTPPHLDEHFHQLLTFCKKHFKNIDIENDIKEPRPKSIFLKHNFSQS